MAEVTDQPRDDGNLATAVLPHASTRETRSGFHTKRRRATKAMHVQAAFCSVSWAA